MPAGSAPVIIVGTGRCGSTMLSRLLGQHPQVLSLSELFGLLRDPFPAAEITGAEFAELLAGPTPLIDAIVRTGVPVDEVRYPFGRGRFERAGTPALCLVTLASLTDDPDALYDEVVSLARGCPVGTVESHYRRLFDRLAARFGRPVVVERSGGSLHLLGPLLRTFPDARIVHLWRHGPDAAVSMSRHPMFRVAAQSLAMKRYLGTDPWADPRAPRRPAALPADLVPYLPERFTAGALERPIPMERFGRLWSWQLCAGAPYLAGLPDERLLTVCYDNLVARPEQHLSTLADFAGLAPSADWLAAATRAIRPGRSHGDDLPPADRAILHRACRLGETVLRRLAAGTPLGLGLPTTPAKGTAHVGHL